MTVMKSYPTFLNPGMMESSLEIAGMELAALWPTKPEGKDPVKELYDKTVMLHRKGHRKEAIELSRHFDEQVYRFYHDQRSGSDKMLEPIKAAQHSNRVLKDGMTRFSEILADTSAEFFYYLVSGTGTTGVNVGQKGLIAENARADMRTGGVMDSIGNILLMRCQFPTGIASATITEFGATDKPSSPSIFAWRVVLDATDYFIHEQGETWYTASHYLVMYAK